MSEKERNPLKRGRVQGKALLQKKKSQVGEISDPFSVLSDSIATKGRGEYPNAEDYIPSENTEEVKTTTVDPLLDSAGEDIGTAREGRRSEDHPHHRRSREGHGFDSNRRDSRQRDRGRGTMHREKSEPCTCTQKSGSCSIKERMRHFCCKILKFLGFKSSCSCPCDTPSRGTRSLSNADRHHFRPRNEGMRGGDRRRGGHHHSKSSPQKF